MKKLLRNCAASKRPDGRPRARRQLGDPRELNRIRMNKKTTNRYVMPGATAGTHINYRSK
jgi:hypothetical protein